MPCSARPGCTRGGSLGAVRTSGLHCHCTGLMRACQRAHWNIQFQRQMNRSLGPSPLSQPSSLLVLLQDRPQVRVPSSPFKSCCPSPEQLGYGLGGRHLTISLVRMNRIVVVVVVFVFPRDTLGFKCSRPDPPWSHRRACRPDG